ncbi:MAG: thiol-disulfide oxidoreductase DCC family protein [Phycisphaerales bacterium]
MSDPFAILVDGKCNLCRREARFMQKLDAGRGRLRIVDITAPDFDSSRYRSSLDELMGQIHGVTPDGRLITGMEVFRNAYRAVAEGGGVRARITSAAMSLTGWPVVRPLTDVFYRWFARNRMRISASSAKLLGQTPEMVCEGDRCKVP